MPCKNHGKKMRPKGAFSTPFRLSQLKLPTFHLSQNDASNAKSYIVYCEL